MQSTNKREGTHTNPSQSRRDLRDILRILAAIILILVFGICSMIMVTGILRSNAQNESEKVEYVTLSRPFTEAVVFAEAASLEPTPTLEPDPIIHDVDIDQIVEEICAQYPNVSPFLVHSIIQHESNYTVDAWNGYDYPNACIGLMQVSTYWHASRAQNLGVTDLWDPYGNVLVGVDYLSDLLESCDNNVAWALMEYNGTSNAKECAAQGKLSKYAESVIAMSNELEVKYNAERETQSFG